MKTEVKLIDKTKTEHYLDDKVDNDEIIYSLSGLRLEDVIPIRTKIVHSESRLRQIGLPKKYFKGFRKALSSQSVEQMKALCHCEEVGRKCLPCTMNELRAKYGDSFYGEKDRRSMRENKLRECRKIVSEMGETKKFSAFLPLVVINYIREEARVREIPVRDYLALLFKQMIEKDNVKK